MKTDNIEKRTLSIERIFSASRQLVWEAWTQPEHLKKWWAPPGMEMEIEVHDFRAGGKWKFIMPMPDGNQFISEGQYLEIQPPEKIITTADFKPMTEGVELHVTFETVEGGTKMNFSVVHPSEEYCLQQEKMGFYNGWGSAFERLAGVLG